MTISTRAVVVPLNRIAVSLSSAFSNHQVKTANAMGRAEGGGIARRRGEGGEGVKTEIFYEIYDQLRAIGR